MTFLEDANNTQETISATGCHQFPNIDRDQAGRQLELLGYKTGDNVYLRFFYPSDDPRKDSDKGRKLDRLNWKVVEELQRQGRGAYFVINGGGHKNEDVQVGRAIFFEHDNLDKGLQSNLWKSLGLPEPTFQVDTGGKSIHSYWVFDTPLLIAQWYSLQCDLLEYADADRSIKNPARVMRLAGAWHISHDESGQPIYNQSRIISVGSKTYSYEELRSLIPATETEAESLPLPSVSTPALTTPFQSRTTVSGINPEMAAIEHPNQLHLPVKEAVPLLACCRKEVRSWVNTGVSKGNRRNDTAINVGLELIAVERYLQSIGQPFEPQARQLFSEFCQRSGMTTKEDEERWKWCQAKTPAPSSDASGVEACVRGWYWNKFVKPIKQSAGRSSSPVGDGSHSKPITQLTMRAHILEILDRNLEQSELSEAFSNLAKSTGWQSREIKSLALELEADLDLEASRRERQAEIQELESHKTRSLTLKKYLPPSYAEPMTQVAQWMGTPTAALLTLLFPALGSCLHPKTQVIVKESINFIESAIIYAGLVTESGQRKSPTMNLVLRYIKEIQAEEEERYANDKAEYDRELEEWESKKDAMPLAERLDVKPQPPAKLREFYLDKTTSEAIDKIKGEQPDTSILWIKDELSGLFNSYGAYKNGRGEDKESVLSGWNGDGVKKNLKNGERVSLLNDAMSVVGAIQNSALQKHMGNFDDAQGEWARFLWCLIPLKALRLPSDDTTFQLTFLKDLYQRARKLEPQDYRFAFDAQAMYDNFHWQLELERVAHPRPGMRAAIAKMEGYAARLALVLHLIWELEAGKTEPSRFIPRERVSAAIGLTKFYLSQVTLIHSEGAAALNEGGLSHRLSAILDKLKQFGELTARKLQAAISWLRKEPPGKLRNDLIELAKLGYGKTVGKGNRLKLVLMGDSRCTVDSAEPTADLTADNGESLQALDIRGIQEFVVEPAVLADTSFSPQHTQQLNSLPSNLENVSCMAAEQVSTVLSTVEPTDLDPDDSQGYIQHSSTLSEEADSPENGRGGLPPTPLPTAPTDEGSQEEAPTLAELKALLLACTTLEKLQDIRTTHKAAARQAYAALTLKEQAQIDSIAATAVPYQVYKYLGKGQEQLTGGQLVYIDPDSDRSKNVDYVPVWLIDGTECGWKAPINVSLSELQAVSKATANDVVSPLRVGDLVYWDSCPSHCEQFAPFEITGIEGEYARLELFSKPVLLSLLRLAT